MQKYDVAIVGAGFTGLAAAYELLKSGKKVHIIEADSAPGGLAGTFEFDDGVRIEKFYHHIFNNDAYVPRLAKELGIENEFIMLPSKNGIYLNGRTWNLSTPFDLIRFNPLSIIDRIRLGLLVFQVKRIKNWKYIENLSIREWLEPICGKNVFKVVWEPLITSKFSLFSEKISAVWMWKKLYLRGSTRNSRGEEELAYFKGGFGKFIDALTIAINDMGGKITYKNKIDRVETVDKKILKLNSKNNVFIADKYLFTPSLPVIANIFQDCDFTEWITKLKRVQYLGNLCLVLQLNKNLSDTYWLNVNDPGFPFVGVIEHTNFDAPENYNKTHIVFLSRYTTSEDPLWAYSNEQYFEFATSHLRRMFPDFKNDWVLDHKIWRSKFAQPLTEINYTQYMPSVNTPFENGWISTMAQIYPEDRGINYAIRDGRKVANIIASS